MCPTFYALPPRRSSFDSDRCFGPCGSASSGARTIASTGSHESSASVSRGISLLLPRPTKRDSSSLNVPGSQQRARTREVSREHPHRWVRTAVGVGGNIHATNRTRKVARCNAAASESQRKGWISWRAIEAHPILGTMNINELLDHDASLPDLPEDIAGHFWVAPGQGQRACAPCVGNAALEWMFDDRHGERCSLCLGEASWGVPVDGLLEYVYRALHREYADPANESLPIDPDTNEYFMVDVFSTEELLYELGESFANDALPELLADAVDHDWVSVDGVADSVEQRMIGSWNTFEQRIQTGPRFLFAADQASFGEASFAQFQDFLQTMAAHLQSQLVRQQPAGLSLFRSRPDSEAFDTAEDLGSPPPGKTGPQRLSAAGVQCFYASEDLPTATAESRPKPGEVISVGEWRTTKPLVVIDFAADWVDPSIFDRHAGSTRHFDRFMRAFSHEISKPADMTGVPSNDYLATQVIAEFFRYKLSTAHQQGVDAIRYRSSLTDITANWCVFGAANLGAEPAVELVRSASEQS